MSIRTNYGVKNYKIHWWRGGPCPVVLNINGLTTTTDGQLFWLRDVIVRNNIYWQALKLNSMVIVVNIVMLMSVTL